MAGPVPVRIVEGLAPRNDGMQVFTDVSTLTAAHPDLPGKSHHLAVTSGTDITRYVSLLDKDLAPLGTNAQAGVLHTGGDIVVTLNTLAATLTA